MSERRKITVTLTRAQFDAIASCMALHEAEDDDFRDDRGAWFDQPRRGMAIARENAWVRLSEAWYAAAPQRRSP